MRSSHELQEQCGRSFVVITRLYVTFVLRGVGRGHGGGGGRRSLAERGESPCLTWNEGGGDGDGVEILVCHFKNLKEMAKFFEAWIDFSTMKSSHF